MPTYGYRCEQCGNEFDVWQRMTDAPGADCPACGSPSRRLFFPAGIVFKGSGFYKTDSRRSTEPSRSSGSSSPSSPSTSPSTSSDTGSSDSSGSSSTPSSPSSAPATAAASD